MTDLYVPTCTADDDVRLAFAAGRFAVLPDSGGAVLAVPAHVATGAQVAFAIRHSSGILHAAAPSAVLDHLRIPDQTVLPSENSGLPFAVAVDAAEGVSTGISARDRAHTLRLIARPDTRADDLTRPGHVIPVRCADGGYRERARVWERAVDLVRESTEGSGAPVAMVCRLVNSAGDTLTDTAAVAFGAAHQIAVAAVSPG